MTEIEQRPLLAVIEGEGTDRGSTPPDPSRGLIELWYSVVSLCWSTLAVVTPEEGAHAWWLAQAMVAVHGREPPLFKAVDLVGATPARMAAVSHAIAPSKLEVSADRTRFVIAVDSPLTEPRALGVLSICDAALLLVERETTRIQDVRRMLALVGRKRFIGAVLDLRRARPPR